MNLNEECLLKYLQDPEELVDLTSILIEFNMFLSNKNCECQA